MNNQVDLKKAQKIDPLKKQPLEGVKSEELSPMDTPEAYKPPATVEQVPYEKMPMFLKKLIDSCGLNLTKKLFQYYRQVVLHNN